MRPAYLSIAAAVIAITATALGLADVIENADAMELLGFATVTAILGLREQ